MGKLQLEGGAGHAVGTIFVTFRLLFQLGTGGCFSGKIRLGSRPGDDELVAHSVHVEDCMSSGWYVLTGNSLVNAVDIEM